MKKKYSGTIRRVNLPFEGLSEELEAMAGRNMLESLSLYVIVNRYETEDAIGSMIQNVEKVLVKPALRKVSFKVLVLVCCRVDNALVEELQSLIPDKYLSHLSKHESITLNFSSYLLK